MSPGPLGLDDADYFADVRRREPDQLKELLAAEFRGLLLDGPTAVPLAERQVLPLAGWFALTQRQLDLGTVDERALLVASCLDDGQVLADTALRPEKAPVRRPGADRPPKGRRGVNPDASVSLSMFDLDARERLRGLRWAPATWSFWLLLRDIVSDPVRVRLDGAPANSPPPAQDAPPWPAPMWPPQTDALDAPARYREVEGAPAPPGAPGIALEVERALVPTEPGARWSLRAGWRLPVRPADRVPEPKPDGPPPPFAPEVRAVVPITLVITGARGAGPWRVPLRVPCLDLAGDVGTGQLELDLLRVRGAPRAPGETYFIYAVAGEVLAGPAVSALVSEDALPKGVA